MNISRNKLMHFLKMFFGHFRGFIELVVSQFLFASLLYYTCVFSPVLRNSASLLCEKVHYEAKLDFSGFQRKVLKNMHVKILSEPYKTQEQKKIKESVLVAEFACNSQNTQFGLALRQCSYTLKF